MARVMVVDDEDAIREIVSEIIEEASHTVIQAVNAREAWSFLTGDSQAPALIVTDQMMPHMSGTELIQLVRSTPRLRKIPIILMSAAKGVQNVEACFLAKPFELDELLYLVETCLNGGSGL